MEDLHDVFSLEGSEKAQMVILPEPRKIGIDIDSDNRKEEENQKLQKLVNTVRKVFTK